MIEEVWNERLKKAAVAGEKLGASPGQSVGEGQVKQPAYAGSAS
jgi:hypothetical protein